MQTRISPEAALYHFDSLHELGVWIETAPRTWPDRAYSLSTEGGKGYKWDLGTGYAEAVRLAQEGWIEGAERAQEALKAFNPATPQPETKTDFYGFRPHVPRFCAGAPDSMVRHARPPLNGSKRVLTLVVQTSIAFFTEARCAANYGIAVAQYVNQLEGDDTRVELIAAATLDYRGRRGAFTWTLKQAEQPLDLAVVAFAIGHPAMFRRLVVAAMERSDLRPQTNYGVPMDAEASDLINYPPGTVILNGMREANSLARTPQDALEHITQQIEKSIQEREL